MSSASRPKEDVSIFVGAAAAAAAADDEVIGCGFPEIWLGRANSAVLGTDGAEELSAEGFVLVPVGLGVARRGTNAIASAVFEDIVAQAAAAARMRVAGRRILRTGREF